MQLGEMQSGEMQHSLSLIIKSKPFVNFNFKSTSIRDISNLNFTKLWYLWWYRIINGTLFLYIHFPEQRFYGRWWLGLTATWGNTRYCPNSGPERVALGIPSIWVHMHVVKLRINLLTKYTITKWGYYSLAYRELGTEKAFREKSANAEFTHTKCCDYLNIPMP
ncbi:hypothetical protein H8356DRAFT_1356645 [Neocallimastix lanati (nom. inval.)]|nr:hypothetical protein H8356DRAFT_1356645 [Neocallimastix sp. JGI-2020a]